MPAATTEYKFKLSLAVNLSESKYLEVVPLRGISASTIIAITIIEYVLLHRLARN